MKDIRDATAGVNLDHFWDALASTYAQFRDLKQIRGQTDPLLSMHEFNPLREYPILRTQAKTPTLVAPIPPLVLDKVVSGLFFAMSNVPGMEADRNPFRQFFGRVFEEYVGWQIRDYFPSSSVLSERSYGTSRGQQRGPDWIVIQDDVAILIQATIHSPTMASLTSGDIDTVRKDADRKFVKPVSRVYDVIARIRDGHMEWQDLRCCRKFIPVLLTLEPLEPISCFYDSIDRSLPSDALAASAKDPYRLLCSEDFERLLAFSHKIPLTEVLTRPNRDVEWSSVISEIASDTHNLVDNKLLSTTFDQFFAFLDGDRWAAPRA